MALPGVFSQRSWPGAGDVDDCWVVATIWAAVAADPAAVRPSVTTFRAAAGDPDDGVTDGGSLDEVIRGARKVWPALPVRPFASADFDAFLAAVRSGSPASLAVWAGKLPAGLRFGFLRAHQVGIGWDAGLWLMNPLATSGARPLAISASALKTAAVAPELGYGGLRAALFDEEPAMIPAAITDTTPAFIDAPIGTPLLDLDGKTPLAARGTSVLFTNRLSPYAVGTLRALIVTTGGLRRVALLKPAAIRPVPFLRTVTPWW
jgi:hypothetical protein